MERCMVCKQTYPEYLHVETLPCCGVTIRICGVKCPAVIARVSNNKMTVASYAAKYVKLHRLVCSEQHRM